VTNDVQGATTSEAPAGHAGCAATPGAAVDAVSPEAVASDVVEAPEPHGRPAPRAEPAPSATQIFEPTDTYEKTVVRKLNKWSQGCLVPGLRLFWASPDGEDVITGGTLEGSEPGSWSVREYEEPAGESPAADSSGLRLGIITSQTCDVILTGVGEEHPVVQVSPVVRAEDHFPNQLSEIQRHMIGYLVFVDNVPSSTDGTYDPGCAELAEGTWVADLRISLPVSKAALLRTKPRLAFTSDQATMEFGEICAGKTRRPSWHEDLAEAFPKEITKTIRAARDERDEAWLGPVEQVRLELLAGTKLEPLKVAPVVLYDSDFPPEYRERWVEMLAEAGSRISRNIDVVTAKFFDVNKMPAKEYRETDPLSLPLGRLTYW
jgi:hypothetical protein